MDNFINDDFTLGSNNLNGDPIMESGIPNPRTLVNYYLNDNRVVRSYKIERNQNCPCGSGRKYKKCCLRKRPEKDKKEYLEELRELMKFEGLTDNEYEILDLMEQMLDDYPVDPEVIELSIGILDYYDFHEEVLKHIARVAKIRIDEFEDEYYLALLNDIFMEGYFKDILDFYELKRDLFAKNPDLKLFYGVSLFETDNISEASDVLESLMDDPGFEEKYSYGVLFEYLFETGNVDQALQFYYDNFRKIAAEKDNNDNMSRLLKFFDKNLDFNKIESKSDEDDLLKYIIKSLISPLEFYNKFNDMDEVPVKWYLSWDKYDKALATAEAIVEQARKSGQESELSLEFYYYYAIALDYSGEEAAAIELLTEKSRDYLAEDLPEINQVYLGDNLIFKIISILIYNFAQSGQQEKAVELMTKIDRDWLLPVLAEYLPEYVGYWNGDPEINNLIETLLDNLEIFESLSEHDIYSFYYWSMSIYLKYFVIYINSYGNEKFSIENNLPADNNYDYDGLAFKYYEFLKNNYDRLSFEEFYQEDRHFFQDIIKSKPEDIFDSRVILDCICWLEKPANEILNYLEDISEELLLDEKESYKILANRIAEYKYFENDIDDLPKPNNVFKNESLTTAGIARIGILLTRTISRVLRDQLYQTFDDYKLNEFIERFNDKISDPAAEVLFKINFSDDEDIIEGLNDASKYQEELTPVLLGILKDTANKVKEYEENPESVKFDDFSKISGEAMLLLAEFKEEQAFPLVLDIFSATDEKVIYYLLGDILTDDGSAIISSVYNGDITKVKEIIENPEIYEFSRVAAFNSLIALIANNKLNIEQLHDYFKYLFDGGLEKERSFLWDQLAVNSARFGFGDLEDEVNNALKNLAEDIIRDYDSYQGLVNDFGDYEEDMADFTGEFRFYQDIQSAAEVVKKWIG